MLAIRDVTALRQIQQEASEQKRELKIIGQILSVEQEKFHEFIGTSKQFFQATESILQEFKQPSEHLIIEMFRNIHTIKGNARTYGFDYLTNRVHETEELYDELRKSIADTEAPCSITSINLLESPKKSEKILQEYEEINDKKLNRGFPGRRGGAGAGEQFVMVNRKDLNSIQKIIDGKSGQLSSPTQSLQDINNIITLIETAPLEDIINSISNSIASTAKELNKPMPEIKVVGNDIQFKNKIRGVIKNAFMHVLRNSLDHGIEDPKTRLLKGKPEAGTINIECFIEKESIIIKCYDDGKGLNLSKIKEIAVSKKIIEATSNISLQEIANLIFKSGFSTAEIITEISGRGMGLEAVKAFFEKENGNIFVELLGEPDEEGFIPFQFIFNLPIDLGVVKKVC